MFVVMPLLSNIAQDCGHVMPVDVACIVSILVFISIDGTDIYDWDQLMSWIKFCLVLKGLIF